MADYCATDPTSGCDNSQLLNAINTCCATTNSNLTAINTKLTAISLQQTECCETMNTNMLRMIELLEIICEQNS